MRRIFTNNDLKIDQEILLDENETHYLKNVLHLAINDKVILFNGKEKNEFVGIIKQFTPALIVKIEKEILIPDQNDTSISLGFALLKGTNSDFIIQKGTEIGIDTFIPFFSERTIISKLDKTKETKKIERWHKIVIAASKQCHRNITPTIHNIATIPEILSMDYNLILIASLATTNTLPSILQPAHKKILVIVGPEGGFSKEELKTFSSQKNSAFFTLGNNILRAETAAIIAPALVKYELEIKSK